MNTKRRWIGVLLLFVMATLAACGGGGGSGNSQTTDFPVNEPFAAALVSKGIPADIADFFAAAKLSSNCSSETTCTYLYTYPNGATRELTLTATPNQQYTPTTDELDSTASVTNPVYHGYFAASGIEDSTPPVDTQIDISFFVPTTSIPEKPAIMAPASSITAKAVRRARVHAPGVNDGFQLNLNEIGAKGADVAIGSLLEHYADTGQTGHKTGNVYAVASALSDIAGAMTISKQVSAWLSELDSLEKCAADPTNPLTQSDPTYTATAVANLRAARAELKQISAVRFINAMGETGEGIHSVTAILSIPLKQVHSWSEQTLKDSSEKLMQDARSSVVSCKPSCPTSFSATGVSESRIDVSWNASTVSSGISAVTNYILSGGNANGVTTAQTTFPDIGLEKSTQYCYTISAFNDYGASDSCPQACGTTFGPPVVVSTGPYNNATGVSVKTAVTATFSEDVDAATVNGSTFTLAGSDGSVAGAVSYSGTTATFTPSADLKYSKTYTATVTTGVIDLDGIAMEASHTWSFTTEAAPLAGNLQFSTTVTGFGVNTTNGVASVAWTLIEDLPDVRTYTASGTISGSLAPVLSGYTCTPLAVTSQIATTDKLLVYTAVNTLWPSTHAFTVTADDMNTTLTTDCTENSDGSTISVPFSKLLYAFVGGNCLPSYTPQPVPFTDAAHLSGTYNCPGEINFSGTNATWDFIMQ
ncbi:MAG: Ig-like domain-containing protein [Gallionella sp.]|nr:Ig-like domain-containing protein [Gallionella sp.]